jgi:hypothetical protein
MLCAHMCTGTGCHLPAATQHWCLQQTAAAMCHSLLRMILSSLFCIIMPRPHQPLRGPTGSSCNSTYSTPHMISGTATRPLCHSDHGLLLLVRCNAVQDGREHLAANVKLQIAVLLEVLKVMHLPPYVCCHRSSRTMILK